MGVDAEDDDERDEEPEVDLCAQTIKEFVQHPAFEYSVLSTIIANGIVMVRPPSCPMASILLMFALRARCNVPRPCSFSHHLPVLQILNRRSSAQSPNAAPSANLLAFGEL